MSLFRYPILIATALALAPAGAAAQNRSFEMPMADPPAEAETAPESGTGAPEDDSILRGIEGAMENLLQRSQPYLEGLANELQGAFSDLAPAFEELAALVDDISNYEAPERLPNGDILLRRRADAPPPPPLNELRGLGEPEAAPVPEQKPGPIIPSGPQIDL